MSFQELTVISDNMIISSNSSFFSLEHFKIENGGGLQNFRDMDGLKILGTNIVQDILEALPEKIR